MPHRTKIKTQEDLEWLSNAEKNAEHRARLFIDSGNYEKAASVLKELPYKKSLEFLYTLGRNYLHHHDARALTVAHTTKLVLR
ncbi:MAG: hypothetical protein WCO65_00305 [bacterium]